MGGGLRYTARVNKAFIFDMDGVLVNSEQHWAPYELPMLKRLLGEDIALKLGDLTGTSIKSIFKKAQEFGSTITEQELANACNEVAVRDVYPYAPVTDGLDVLGDNLVKAGFVLGLVTQSPRTWIDAVLPRIPFREQLKAVISIRDEGLEPKPSPEGYVRAIELLKVEPENCFILEDSNAGIEAGKAAGCFVIGFRGNLQEGYEQTGADRYADTMEEVQKILESLDRN